MKRSLIYIALCAVAVDKKVIAIGEPIPSSVNDARIKSLLANGSIEAVEGEEDNSADLREAARIEVLIKRAIELGITQPEAIKTTALEIMVADAESKVAANLTPPTESNDSTVVGDGTGVVLSELSNSMKEAAGVNTESTATLTGAVNKDGRVVELGALSVAALKKLATDLEVTGASQMKKDALVSAITAIEFKAEE